jgi:hypothetical protein
MEASVICTLLLFPRKSIGLQRSFFVEKVPGRLLNGKAGFPWRAFTNNHLSPLSRPDEKFF